jgi:PAS domain S-box-containing protein
LILKRKAATNIEYNNVSYLYKTFFILNLIRGDIVKEIIERTELRKRFKLELDIIAKFFSTKKLKISVLTPENELKVFKQQNYDFEQTVRKIEVPESLYKKIMGVEEAEIKDILADYLSDFKNDLIFFKVTAAEYIYIVYFPVDKELTNYNSDSINLFKKQLKSLLEDIYVHEKTKDNLSEKNLENKNLKKEKYITASALDSVPGNISILDKNGRIVYTNSSWEQFAAENDILPQNVGVGENYLEVCKKATAEGDLLSARAYNGIISVLDDNQDSFSMDYPCHSPVEKRWFRMYVSSFKGVGSYEVMILHQNITREVLAEKNFEEILNKLPAAILKFDSEKKLVYFNEKAMNLLNLNENNLGRKSIDLKIADNSEDKFLDKLNVAADSKERIEFKVLVENNNLTSYYSNYLIPEYEADNLKTITSIIPEDELNKKLRNKKMNQKNQYLQFFNNFPYASVLLNIEEKIINVNKEFCLLFGYERDELNNKKLDDLIVAAGKNETARKLSHLVLTGTQVEREVVRINSQGEKLNLKLIAFPVLLNNQKMGVFAIYKRI